ncbi:MAG TPA: DUF3341 domain-containing protein [Candidatus Limnocylindrales bacterium]|nr:DUF3341 domain-containing protein [Candidatus Limnocylindrales bacterium]
MHAPTHTIHGVMAEFVTPDEFVAALRKIRAAGYTKFDGYSPFPIHEASQAAGLPQNPVALMVLIGGILGGLGGFALATWVSMVGYPVNIGGRPLFSWPAFIPPVFETTVLLASLTAVFGMLAINGLPLLYHPVWNVPAFARASQDRFFVCIEAIDPKFDASSVKTFLAGLGSASVSEVDS